MAKKKKTIHRPVEVDPDQDVSETRLGNLVTRLLFRPRLLLSLAILASAVACYPKVKSFLPDLSQRDEYRLLTTDITITPPPHWVADDLVEQVVARTEPSRHTSLLDDDLVEKLAEAFRAHPWVANVSRVRLLSSGIEIDLVYRQPVAMVELRQGMYPIDADGTLLPPDDFSSDDIKRFPVIRNVKSTPQGPAGMTWGDVGVQGAAKLADVIGAVWKQFHLVAIHVPNRNSANTTIDDMVFELSTVGGSRIVWGRAPHSDHPGELTAEQKIGRLDEYQAKYGQFDQPHGPYRIEIHHWREISRRPLSARNETSQPR